jgi:hypothetical protein
MMCHATANLASCEIRAVPSFLKAARKTIANYLCAVYGQNITTEGTVR